ncbi:protein phosphatase 1 regulatory subunit 12A-like isoform X2 [Rhopilema esculentum]
MDLVTKILNLKEDIVRTLVNTNNCLGQTPLHLAVITGQLAISKLLTQYRANLASRNNEGDTSIHLATKLGKNDCLEFLSQNSDKQTINLPDDAGKSPLHLAVETQNILAISILAKNEADINFQNAKTGENALHYAVKKENEDMIRKLLELGVDVNAADIEGNTPLHSLPNAEHRQLAQLLLENGADVYKKNHNGQSPHDRADKTMQRFLQRNRKDKKTRRRRVKDGSVTNQNSESAMTSVETSSEGIPLLFSLPQFQTVPPEKKLRLKTDTQRNTSLPNNSDISSPPLVNWLLSDESQKSLATDESLEVLDEGQNTSIPFTSYSCPVSNTSDGTIDVTSSVMKNQDGYQDLSQLSQTLTRSLTQPTNSQLQECLIGINNSCEKVDLASTSSPLNAQFSTTTAFTSSIASTESNPMTVTNPQAAGVSTTPTTSASQCFSIDQAFNDIGLFDKENQELAQKMPTFLCHVEEVARHLNITPAEALTKLLLNNTVQQ